ncbi:hypothetical protein BB560_000999 [Smittium megazygosporum]|uniref:Casein kinase II subunit beta n=1 Tax=Smittium megazygosporum TaxID=133381 RepID=A0A2T9ZIU0_9FUNG|nr:hypothetical protein BB560_000999 [Smittium megazygosporum]
MYSIEDQVEDWKTVFLAQKGNSIFCNVDDSYIADPFNLTNLDKDIDNYKSALKLILNDITLSKIKGLHLKKIWDSACFLYGQIHARYILTNDGMLKMLDKYENSAFGTCPRVQCDQQSLIPVGIDDRVGVARVKFYCCNCEDVYEPDGQCNKEIDGAFFTTTFPHLFFLSFPHLKPKTKFKIDRYVPRMFGYKIYRHSKLHKWQERERTKAIWESISKLPV